jgi:O-antigen ligase
MAGLLDRLRKPHTFVWMALALLGAAPWLNPFAGGPTLNVNPVLFAWFCLALAMGLVALAALNWEQVWDVAAWAWVLAAGLSAVIGLLQYFDWENGLSPWVNRTSLGEAFANLRQRNQYATLCAMGLSVVVWRVALGRSAALWRSTKLSTLFVFFLVALLSTGAAASGSRTGAIQVGLLVCLALGWGLRAQAGVGERSAVKWAIFAALCYVAAVLLLPLLAGLDSSVWTRFKEGDGLCTGRRVLWSNVWQLTMLKPWTGWGWGNLGYAHFITLFEGVRFCGGLLDNAHNLPLHLAVELGLPLALLLLAIVGVVVWRAQPWRALQARQQMAWAVLAMVGLHSLLEYPLWYGPFQIAVLLCVLYLIAVHRGLRLDGAMFNTGTGRATGVLVSLLLAGTCAFMGWRYWQVSQLFLHPSERAAQYRDATFIDFKDAFFFRDQVVFASLIGDLNPANAQACFFISENLLRFSPEPRVVQRVIESAVMLGKQKEAQFYTVRFKAAFPVAYAQWSQPASAPSALSASSASSAPAGTP